MAAFTGSVGSQYVCHSRCLSRAHWIRCPSQSPVPKECSLLTIWIHSGLLLLLHLPLLLSMCHACVNGTDSVLLTACEMAEEVSRGFGESESMIHICHSVILKGIEVHVKFYRVLFFCKVVLQFCTIFLTLSMVCLDTPVEIASDFEDTVVNLEQTYLNFS